MNLKSLLRINKKPSARTAKDRLQIIIAQERSRQSQQDYLPMMREEILQVIAKYTKADLSEVKVDFQTHENNSILELNVVLPENVEPKESTAAEESSL